VRLIGLLLGSVELTSAVPSQGEVENRAMPLLILILIEFYNGIMWFLCHITAFFYTPTSASVQSS